MKKNKSYKNIEMFEMSLIEIILIIFILNLFIHILLLLFWLLWSFILLSSHMDIFISDWYFMFSRFLLVWIAISVIFSYIWSYIDKDKK